MSNYGATGAQAAVAAGYKTAVRVTGGTGGRTKLYDLLIGQGGTPADNAVFWALMRLTAAGTDTAVVPISLDPADVASRATAGENATAEATYTAASELLEFSMNQRSSYRWVASPGGELVIPATAAAGIGARIKSGAYTGSAEATIQFNE